MRAHERLELPHGPGVLAKLERAVHTDLERHEPQFLEASDLALRERLVLDPGERRAPPQRERIVQERGGPAGLTGRQRAAPESSACSKRRLSSSSSATRRR